MQLPEKEVHYFKLTGKACFLAYWGYTSYANSIPSAVPVWDPTGEGVLSYRRMNLAYREPGRTVKSTCLLEMLLASIAAVRGKPRNQSEKLLPKQIFRTPEAFNPMSFS